MFHLKLMRDYAKKKCLSNHLINIINYLHTECSEFYIEESTQQPVWAIHIFFYLFQISTIWFERQSRNYNGGLHVKLPICHKYLKKSYSTKLGIEHSSVQNHYQLSVQWEPFQNQLDNYLLHAQWVGTNSVYYNLT